MRLLFGECFHRRRSCISHQPKTFSKLTMKTLYQCAEWVQVTDKRTIFDVLWDLVPFAQFWKTWLWKRGCFSRFLNCTNAKSRKPSHIILVSSWITKDIFQFPRRQKKFCSSLQVIIKHINLFQQYQEFLRFQKLCSIGSTLRNYNFIKTFRGKLSRNYQKFLEKLFS